MNRNPKEKLARIEIRVKSKDKDKIKRLAENVNLSISEYMVQRALGYEPITVLPNAFLISITNCARYAIQQKLHPKQKTNCWR